MPLNHTGSSLRNRIPILLALQKHLSTEPLPSALSGVGMDLSSGTGAHLEVLAPAFPKMEWIPTEYTPNPKDRSALDLLNSNLTGVFDNVQPAVRLDLSRQFSDWPTTIQSLSGTVRIIVNCNVIHISPWSVAVGLFHGVGKLLHPSGVFAIYGPFAEQGHFSSPGNRAFDARLRSQNPTWGIRDLRQVLPLAQQSGLQLQQRLSMPANNLLLLFAKAVSEE